MMRTVLTLLWLVSGSVVVSAADWRRFRGPDGKGIVSGPPIVMEWSAAKNLKWKSALPGKGVSSPVVSGDHVYVTCYTGYGLDRESPGNPGDLVRHLIAFDRASGTQLWQASVPTTAEEDPYQGFIQQHGYASSTPATDGELVFVLFGKSGLFAFDRQGNEVWNRNLGTKSDPAKWGDASSPIVVGDLVVVDAGILGHQLIALNKSTGEEVWSIADESFTNAWATPTIVDVGGRQELLFHVPKQLIAVDPGSGKKLWWATSPVADAVCGSIVTSDGIAYVMGGRVGQGMAVRCGGSGNVSETHTIWKRGIRAGITTPVIVGEQMYWASSGVFYSANLADGEYVYRERLPRIGGPTGGFPNSDYSSPVAVDDQIILFTRSGESYVIQAGPEFKVTAHNPAFEGDESAFSATPAISDGELFVRSEAMLYCISDRAN